MRAAKQGDFDGLCGLYALINTLDLIGFKRPRLPLHRQLFVELASSIPKTKLRTAIDTGLDGRDLIRAAKEAFPGYRKALGGVVTVTQPFRKRTFDTDEAFFETMPDIMASGRSALILNVSTPTYSHWTVALSVTPQAIAVRDSGTMTELSVERYSIWRGRYRIKPEETLLVHLEPSRRKLRGKG